MPFPVIEDQSHIKFNLIILKSNAIKGINNFQNEWSYQNKHNNKLMQIYTMLSIKRREISNYTTQVEQRTWEA